MSGIHHVDLDSKLAKAKIGKMVLDGGQCGAPSYIKSSLKRFDLVFIFSKLNPKFLACLRGLDWVFAGVRITLCASLRRINFPKIILSTEDFFKPSDKSELFLLAVELSRESRFYTDPYVHRLGEKIYAIWMKNSMSGMVADTILVCRIGK